MEARVLFFCIFFIITLRTLAQSTQTFVIDKLWNGTDLAFGVNVTLTLTGMENTKDITLEITAPFFNDLAPSGPPGQSMKGLWKFEVVEAFFVNNFDQYLQLQISPHGQHMVMLLNGSRIYIRQSLPLNLNTSIEDDFWTGTALIPGDYFPPQVTKFNAHATHGSGPTREFWSLYPSDSTITKPDFHALQFCNFVDFASISPSLASNPISALWENALKSAIKYTIDTTWNGQPIEGEIPVTLILTASSDPSELIVNITAPFFGDPPPSGVPGKPFLGLWNYEVVEFFFLNDQNQYLEVEIGPLGHHITLLLGGVRNTIRHSLPLNVSTASGRHIWQGTAVIPGDYLPPNVTRFNAYAIHGNATQRIYWSLYPTDGSTESPDFHNLQFFRAIDLDSIFPANTRSELSPLWDAALQGIIRYDMNSQWNGLPSTVGNALLTLQGFQGGVEVNFTVSNNVKFMPLKYATFIFRNVNGESLKLIVLSTESHSIFFSNATDVLLQESSTMDFRVTANDESMNGSVLIPPEYFPPNVTLLNVYFTFGISVVEVISLQPFAITDSHVNVISSLDEPAHFAQIDFETVIENNLLYSSKWQPLVPTAISTESEPTADAASSEPQPTNASSIESGLSPLTEDVALNTTENPVEVQGAGDEGVNKLLAEIQADRPNNTGILKENIAEYKIVINEDQEAKKVIVTKNEGQGEVKVTSAEIKKDDDQAVKVTDTELAGKIQEESTVSDAEVDNLGQEKMKVTGSEVKQEEGKVQVAAVEVKNEEGPKEVKVADVELQKNEEQKETGIDAEIKKEEGQVEVHVVVTEPQRSKGQEVYITEKDAAVKKNEGQEEGKVASTELQKSNVQEVAGTDVEVKKKEEEVEVKISGAEETKEEGHKEIIVTDAALKKDEGLEIVKFETATTTSMNNEAQLNLPSNREEAQRKIEGEELDRNVLQIPFKISFVSQEKNEESSDPDIGTTQDIGLSSSPQPSTTSIKSFQESDIEDTVDRLIDILNSGPPVTSIGGGLLPPPHPICFTPGLVADNFRCQVFYECVMENGRWEVYNWRCKRGYFYDAEKVACVRGYC